MRKKTQDCGDRVRKTATQLYNNNQMKLYYISVFV